MDVLQRVKRLALFGRIRYTWKARDEMARDGLTDEQVVESLVNAQFIAKTLRSRSRYRHRAGEKLYVIKSLAYDGTFIYTKGTIRRHKGFEVFYVLISAKIATFDD
jgi:hypothetical protein